MSKTRLIHHIVFGTKMREMSIDPRFKKELYAYIMGILNNKRCHLIRINGMGDHVHMLVDLNPTVALATLVKEVKQYSSSWLKESPKFPLFYSWGRGYFAVTLSVSDIDSCKAYIINQEAHHTLSTFDDEMKRLLATNELEWYDDDWQ